MSGRKAGRSERRPRRHVFVLGVASVASILAAGSLPAIAYGLGYGWPVIAFGGAAGLGVAVLHRTNVGRLLAGTENRFQFRRARREQPINSKGDSNFAHTPI